VTLGASRGMPTSLVPKTARSDPKPRTFGTVWWLSSRGHPTMCLDLPCKVINQSIVGLSPLFETT
jgi:hypothetical protein